MQCLVASVCVVFFNYSTGIFSDVHMLGLMYAGEMCYWAWEIGNEVKQTTSEMVRTEDKHSVRDNSKLKKDTANECFHIEQRVETADEAAHCVTERELSTDSSADVNSSFSQLLTSLKGADFVQKWRQDFSPVSVGQEMLAKYIEIAHGPLKHQNWSYTRAVQLAVKLKKVPLS